MDEKTSNILLAAAKGGVSLLPGGGLLAEFLGLAQSSITDKRMNEWKDKVEQTLEKIPQSINELAKSEEFYSCVQTATIGAMQSYQEEKRKYFANALYHSAVNMNLETDKKLFYLRLLNDYTLSHINLLQYFSVDQFHSADRVKKNGMVTTMTFGGTEYPMTGIVENLPEFKNDTAFVKHIAGQLITDSLISVIDFDTPVSKERARCKRITPYGKAFLDFIKEDNEG